MDKDKVFWIILIAFVGLTGLAAFEATARFFEERDKYVVTKEFDPVLGWKLKPGIHSVRPSGRFAPISLEINSYGLRGGAFPVKPEKDERRIMILGDSFVFSRHFLLQDTFPGRLEKILNLDTAKPVRVINAGVPGYGTGQELLFMRKLAENGIIPETYVLVVFPNDILDNLSLSYGNYEEIAVKPRFELDAAGNTVLKSLPKNELDGLQETFRHTETDNPWKLRSLQFIRAGITDFFASRPQLLRVLMHFGIKLELPRKPGLLNGWYDERVLNEGFPLMKALMRDMKEEAVKRGASFRVVMIPSPVQIYPEMYKKILTRQFPGESEVTAWIGDPMRAQRLVGETCKELGVAFEDLYPVLKAQSQRNLYLSRDGHFDRDAHEIVAKALAEWIKNAELYPEDRFKESKMMQGFNASAHQQAVAK